MNEDKKFTIEKDALKDFRQSDCLFGWREAPLGTGECSVIIISSETFTKKQMKQLLKTLKITQFSEENIAYLWYEGASPEAEELITTIEEEIYE